MSTNDSATQNDGNEKDPTNFLRAKLFGETHIRIIRENENISWDHPVHAINWFNSRFLFLYDFYNLLATRCVHRVGGRPLFKGRLLARMLGDEVDQRNVLLIVAYPAPENFRTMLENTYFKIVSVVRAIAVQRFTFCLTHTLSEHTFSSPIGSATHFGVHLFRGDAECMANLLGALRDSDVPVAFSSLKTHTLSTVNSAGESNGVPSLMDGIILFECSEESSLRTLVDTSIYRKYVDNCSSSFVGLFERIL